nr:MAG TPA: hypothetical protein [Caudoviricetes sp.]
MVRGLGGSAGSILLSFAGGRGRPSGRLPPKGKGVRLWRRLGKCWTI